METKIFKCQHCGTETNSKGELFYSSGQLNLHEYHCRNKQLLKEHPKREQQENTKEHDTCLHTWRALSQRQDIELRALLEGYKEVCSKCQELR